jgi:REP element-mobilizing transposase RayT
MSFRLAGFDYRTPFFYMVTIKRSKRAGRAFPPFSSLSATGITESEITHAFREVIQTFHTSWHCLEAIHYFVIMPDHLHLIVKIRNTTKRVSLSIIIRQLIRALEHVYHEVAHLPPTEASRAPIFEQKWHDWIVKSQNQLPTFIRYIKENPKRAWLRRQNRAYFGTIREINFLGRRWYAYGNLDLLSVPILQPFQCSRRWTPTSVEWRRAQAQAMRLGPGCAGISTFMSPCEKLCGNEIFKAHGGMIQLCPEGFGDYWHPTRNKEKLCAEGRMLFLSLYPPAPSKPDKATLYTRCHEMGDLVISQLTHQK